MVKQIYARFTLQLRPAKINPKIFTEATVRGLTNTS